MFFTGPGGSNGKTTHIDLISRALGDYYSKLPVSVITEKRKSSSAATPELANKKGIRFIDLEEPECDDKINVGDEYTLDSSKWQVGDIIVMGYDDKKYGHIQVWTGWKWVSDFTQNKIQANWVDKSSIALWRLNENGKTAVTSEKNKTA